MGCWSELSEVWHIPSFHRLSHSFNSIVRVGLSGVTFSATLSRQYFLGRFFTHYMPLYDQIRFHAWNAFIPVFFGVTLAAFGMREFFEEVKVKQRLILTTAVFIGLAYLAYRSLNLSISQVHFVAILRRFQVYPFFIFLFALPFFVRYRFHNEIGRAHV